jgi:predicted RNA-binding Zn-ribbon protein involved in translation (DUF1610 family)
VTRDNFLRQNQKNAIYSYKMALTLVPYHCPECGGGLVTCARKRQQQDLRRHRDCQGSPLWCVQ